MLEAHDTVLGTKAGQNSISSSGSKPREALYLEVEYMGYMEAEPNDGDVEADRWYPVAEALLLCIPTAPVADEDMVEAVFAPGYVAAGPTLFKEEVSCP